MRGKVVLWSVVLLFWVLGAGARADEFTVLDFSPQGETSGRPALTVSFSAPVAAKELVGKIVPAESLPFTISPALEGDGTWDGADRFVFTPRAPLAPATEYRVTLKPLRDQAGRLLAGPQSFLFRTAPLKLLEVRPTERTPYGEVTVEFVFSLPLPPQRLLGFLTVRSEGRTVNVTPLGQVPAERVLVRTESVSDAPLELTVEKGLLSDAGPLGLEARQTVEVSASSELTLTGQYAESGADGGRLVFYTSRPVDPGDVTGFLSLTPTRDFRVESTYGGFAVVGPFAPRERVSVTLRKGLGGKEGLKADATGTFILPDRERAIRFPLAGTFLSPAEAPRIVLETVNVDAVDVSAWKMYPNNIPLVAGALGEGGEPPRNLARSLGTTAFAVDNRLNETVRSALDLTALLGENRGVFLLEARSGEVWERALQMVTLTDLGISARVWEKGLLVWVNGLFSAEAVAGASVAVYSSSNQLLAQGVTDGDGLWTVERERPWEAELRPAVVTVSSGEDLSFLLLEGDRFAEAGLDRSGAAWVTTYEADCLLPRGIFRPGETVDVTAVVRGPRMALPGSFPVLWKVTNALDMEAARGAETLSASGTAAVSFDLPQAAPTGRYRFDLFVAGAEDAPLGSATFQVEDFTPPRIEVDLASDRPVLTAPETVALSFGAAYLFGAPASDLNWELTALTRPRTFQSGRFPHFAFGDDEKAFQSTEEYVASGALDGEGRAETEWTLPEGWQAPSLVELLFSLQVMEPGGRWVVRHLPLPCAVTPLQIGLRRPQGDLEPGRTLPFQVAAVTATDEPAEATLVWELFSLTDRYVLVREGGRTRMTWQEEKNRVHQGKVTLKQGLADLPLKPEGEGRFLLVLSDGEGSSASARFDLWRPWGLSSRGASLPDRIDLSLDSPLYREGERASLAYQAPFPGRALFTVESEGLLSARVLPVEPAGTVDFPVDGRLWPNGWCTLQVIRPMADRPGPVSAVGAVPVMIETADRRASVELTLPEKAEPGGVLPVEVTVTGEGPLSGDLWLALVDRAILGLTDHGTPDPQKRFTARRRLNGRARDVYDELIPIESRQTPLLHPAGDEARAAALGLALSPLQARGFRILSEVQTVAVEEGKARVSFDLPEFSGGARVMAVFSGASLGSAEGDLSLSRPLTVDPALPEALAPGDELLLRLHLHSTASEDLPLELAFATDGALALTGENRLALTLGGGESRLVDLPLRAADEAGYGRLTVAVTGGGLDFSVTAETAVRPPLPPVTLSGSAVIEKGAFSLAEDGRWFPGTLRRTLYLSGSPRADLLPLLTFLRDYPYGCLEQIVSSAWPLVAVPAMTGSDDIPSRLGAVVSRLQTYQLYSGGFASWPNGTFDPWGSLYAAHFLATLDEGLVPRAMARRVEAFLGAVLSDPADERGALSQKAYAAYVQALSGRPPLGWMTWLRERSADMDDAGRALLAAAYGLAGRKEEGLGLVGKSRAGVDPYASPLRDRALRLLALATLEPGGADEAALAREVLGAIGAGPLSTQEAAVALLVLGRYLERADLRPFSAVVDDGEATVSLAAGEDLLLSADRFVPWQVINEGPGPLYASWTTTGVPVEAVPEEDRGLQVRRTLTDREGRPLDLSRPLSLGEEVHVRIDLLPAGPRADLVVIDVLPGCFDVWDPTLGPSVETASARCEVRFDRVLLFPDQAEGRITLGYRCRVVARGDFTLPPVAAEALYDPTIGSLSGGGRLTVR